MQTTLKNVKNVTIALAGIIQATGLVQELAQSGRINDTLFANTINSIFKTDPDSVEEVYGGIEGVEYGLLKLLHNFRTTEESSRASIRYMLSIMGLQKKISRSSKVIQELSQQINNTKKQVTYFHLTHPTVISNLADAYVRAIKPYGFRLLIMGNQRVLRVNENIDKVRALLLAGIRASVLWRQVGGSRLQLLLNKHKIQSAAEQMLVAIKNRAQ